MDKSVLDQYFDLLQEQTDCKRRIQSSRDKIDRLEKQQVKDTVKGGSGGIQHYVIEGIPYEMIEYEKQLLSGRMAREEKLEIKIRSLTNEVEEFIFNLKDSRMRRILNYRYVEKMSWNVVANKMGGKCTADSVRIELGRFLEKL